jgi:hypothetical protein
MSDGSRCPVTMRARVQTLAVDWTGRLDREHPMRERRTTVLHGADSACRQYDAGARGDGRRTPLRLDAASQATYSPGAQERQAR